MNLLLDQPHCHHSSFSCTKSSFQQVSHKSLLSILITNSEFHSMAGFASNLEEQSYQVYCRGSTIALCRFSNAVPKGSGSSSVLPRYLVYQRGQILLAMVTYHCCADYIHLIILKTAICCWEIGLCTPSNPF